MELNGTSRADTEELDALLGGGGNERLGGTISDLRLFRTIGNDKDLEPGITSSNLEDLELGGTGRNE